jgi:hypothetical protein
MPTFSFNKTSRTPFGKNQYLRSVRDIKTESYTMSAAAMITNYTVDGTPMKILQPGTVIAKITSTAEAGKVGIFQAGATDGRQTAANIVGVVDTFLPWELNERDAEIAVVYEATVVQAWCIEHTATSGGIAPPVALTNTTRDAILALTQVQLIFK